MGCRLGQGTGEHRLSHVVLGLCGGGRRLGGLAWRVNDARQSARNCAHLHGRVSGVEERGMKPFLPFTRPAIDEQSIAAVADVFRSGQLASGPKVAAFEADLAAYL